jgi:ABC-type multidrug transport system fused ATPase/permease subunit
LLTLAFGILLTEKLGYEVEYKAWDSTPGQELLDDHTVTARAYQNVLRGKAVFDLELWPVSGRKGKQEAIKTAKGKTSDFSSIGELGQVARNGWFVDASAVGDPSEWHSLPLLNASGAFNTSSSKRLMLSRELPVIDLRTSFRAVDKALCGSNATIISWYGGILDCTTGSWAPNNASCCTRYLNRTSACTPSMQPCVAFVQNTPTWLKSEHERRVSSSGLPLEIVYANALQTSADAANGSTPMPVLFYWWEPDLSISPQKYIRLAMQDTLYCSQPFINVEGETETPTRNSFSYKYDNYSSPSTCDFERESLEKGAYEPGRNYFGDAFYLFESLQFSFGDVQNILQLRADNAANYTNMTDIEFEAACSWLKSNEDKWSPYIQPESFIFVSLPFVFGALGVALIYVAVQQYMVFRAGSYYKVQKEQSKEVLAAMLKSPVFMLEQMEQRDATAIDTQTIPRELPDGTPQLTFLLRELHVGDDERAVRMTIERRASSSKRACSAEMYFYSETCVEGEDYRFPVKVGNGPGSLNETNPGSGRFRVEFESGQHMMQIEVPLGKNQCWSPRRSFFVCLKPFQGDNPAQIFPLDHLAVFIHQMGQFPRKYRLDTADRIGGFGKITRFMLAFLEETAHVPWIFPLLWRYQLANMLMAVLDTFVWSSAFAELLNVGFLQRRTDYCALIAMIYFGIELFRYHIGLHYFPGSYVLQTHLECLLGKKFSSLSATDLSNIGSAESLFRVSAATDTHTIRTDLWARLHAAFIEFYRLLGAAVFIIFAFREQSLYAACAVAAVLFVFFAAMLFIKFRIRASYLAGIAEDELEVMVYDANHYLYRNTDIVRESKTESRTSMRQHEKLWLFLDGGIFERWYQDYFNKWAMTAILVLIIASLYALAPLALALDGISVGMYIAIVASLAQLGNAVISIADSIAVILASVSKVAHMSELLNIKSSRGRHIAAMYKRYHDKANDSAGFERDHERITFQTYKDRERDAVMYLHDLTVIHNHPSDATKQKPRTVFNAMHAMDESGNEIYEIPAGGFVGVRMTRGTFSSTFMSVLSETDVAYTGTACINPQYVSRTIAKEISFLMSQTFEDNLTLRLTLERSRLPGECRRGLRMAELQKRYDSKALYDLCKRFEVTDSILGERYMPGWGMLSMTNVSSILDAITRFKITLIQCMLTEPDVIIIDGFGDHLTFENLQKMAHWLRLWLDRKLPGIDDDYISGRMQSDVPRTVIWHGTPLVLISTLQDEEPVLNIVSKAEISVAPSSVAFDGVKANDLTTVMSRIRPQQDIVDPVWRNIQQLSMRSMTLSGMKSWAMDRRSGRKPSVREAARVELTHGLAPSSSTDSEAPHTSKTVPSLDY